MTDFVFSLFHTLQHGLYVTLYFISFEYNEVKHVTLLPAFYCFLNRGIVPSFKTRSLRASDITLRLHALKPPTPAPPASSRNTRTYRSIEPSSNMHRAENKQAQETPPKIVTRCTEGLQKLDFALAICLLSAYFILQPCMFPVFLFLPSFFSFFLIFS